MTIIKLCKAIINGTEITAEMREAASEILRMAKPLSQVNQIDIAKEREENENEKF